MNIFSKNIYIYIYIYICKYLATALFFLAMQRRGALFFFPLESALPSGEERSFSNITDIRELKLLGQTPG